MSTRSRSARLIGEGKSGLSHLNEGVSYASKEQYCKVGGHLTHHAGGVSCISTRMYLASGSCQSDITAQPGDSSYLVL
jgi:hypothetical protein